jgi:CubicO group peptidase (beta-lactamase class C family)
MLVAPGGSYESTLEPAKTEITLRHLITHTSGLTYQTTVSGVGDVCGTIRRIWCHGLLRPSKDRAIESLEAEAEFLAQLPLISHPEKRGTILSGSICWEAL